MKTKTICFILTCLALTSTAYAQSIDTVILKNGDRLKGKVLSQTKDHVYFKSPAFGSVGISKRDVDQILLYIEKPEVAPALIHTAPPPAPKTQVQEPGEKSKWSGNAGLSVTFRESGNLDQDGNTKDELEWEYYDIQGDLKWEKGSNSLKWSTRYRYTERDKELQDNFFNFTQDYRHDLTKTYYTQSKSMYQRDFRRNIDAEHLQTAELGIKWLNTKKFKLTTSGGGAYHHYERTDRATQPGATEPPSFTGGKFIIDQNFRWQANGTLALFETFTHLGDLETYYMYFKGGMENKLVKDLFLQVAYSVERETEFSYRDRAYYDTKLFTSVHYKF